MKKLLYITVNSKPENESASKMVGRRLVNQILATYHDFQLEELDLYEVHVPRLESQYFESRNCMINQEAINQLPKKEQEEVHKIVKLCDQFVEADVVVMAAPMWSLFVSSSFKRVYGLHYSSRTHHYLEGHLPKGYLMISYVQ